MASRILNPNNFALWVKKDTGVWPVIGVISVALGWCAYNSGRHLFTSPDVSINPNRRSMILKDTTAESSSWVSGHKKHIAANAGEIRILGSFDRKL